MKLTSKTQIYITFTIALLAIVLIFPMTSQFNLNIKWFVREAAQMAKLNPFSGYLSTLGGLAWGIAAAICLFSAFLLNNRINKRQTQFLIYAGVLTLILLLDDSFMLHEKIFPEYLGVPEKIIYGIYLVLAGFMIIYFRKIIIETRFLFLLIAAGFMGLSIIMDYIQEPYLYFLGQYEYLLEEGLKWIGICWWTSYFIQTCGDWLRKQFQGLNN